MKKWLNIDLAGLHEKWLNEILALQQFLRNTETTSVRLQFAIHNPAYRQEAHILSNEIQVQRDVLKDLQHELMTLIKKWTTKKDKDDVSISELRENNIVRNKINKASQLVYMLKYQAGKLLSLAS